MKTGKKTEVTDPGGVGAPAPSNAWVGDISGAFADLGTFLPLVLGVLALGGFSPTSVLFGFGSFALLTALIYRRPVPVQPMKVVAALVIALGATAGSVAATGLLVGVSLLVLGATGAAERLKRAIPQTVLAGVSLGIGLHLAVIGGRLMAGNWPLGAATLALVLILLRTPLSAFACLLALVSAGLWGLVGADAVLPALTPGLHLPHLVVPSLGDFADSIRNMAVPQLMLTITNAVIATAALAASYFPKDAARNITTGRLCLTTGAFNLLLAPFGALPMCHGAGGLVAQYRFGARTGLATAVFGATCLGLGIVFGDSAAALLRLLPLAAVGALLLIAGGELALSKRLFDGRPSCLVVIFLTGAVCVGVNVAVGIVVGFVAEILRSKLVRLYFARKDARSGQPRADAFNQSNNERTK